MRLLVALQILFTLVISGGVAWAQPALENTPTTAPVTTAATSSTTMPTGNKAVVIDLVGPIDLYSRDRLFDRLDKARELGVDHIILKINTYGGRVDAALDIT